MCKIEPKVLGSAVLIKKAVKVIDTANLFAADIDGNDILSYKHQIRQKHIGIAGRDGGMQNNNPRYNCVYFLTFL